MNRKKNTATGELDFALLTTATMELAKTSSCIAQYYRMQGIFLAFVQCQKALLATVRKEYKDQNVIISLDDVENLWTVFQCQYMPLGKLLQVVLWHKEPSANL